MRQQLQGLSSLVSRIWKGGNARAHGAPRGRLRSRPCEGSSTTQAGGGRPQGGARGHGERSFYLKQDDE